MSPARWRREVVGHGRYDEVLHLILDTLERTLL